MTSRYRRRRGDVLVELHRLDRGQPGPAQPGRYLGQAFADRGGIDETHGHLFALSCGGALKVPGNHSGFTGGDVPTIVVGPTARVIEGVPL
jgi:hypothetical protein